MKRNLKNKLLLAVLIVLLPQIILGQTDEEKALAEKAVAFFSAAKKGEWGKIQMLSTAGADGRSSMSKEWIEYWTKNDTIIPDIQTISNFTVDKSDASFRITFRYRSKTFNNLLPRSYDFSFQKQKNEWKINSFEPSSNRFISRFIYAVDLAEEKALIEREKDYLLTWESLDILGYADRDWIKDNSTILKFQRLFEAIIIVSDNKIIKAEAYWNLGKIFLINKDYKNAKDSFDKGLTLGNESNFEYTQFLNITGLSEVSVYENDLQRALELFDIAFSFYSIRSDAYFNAVWSSSRIGNAFYNTKNYDAAIKIYKQGIKVAENFKDEFWQITLLMDTGDGNFQLKNYKEAQNWYKKTLDFVTAPGTNQIYRNRLPQIYKTIGITYQYSGDFELAIGSYKKAVNLAIVRKEPGELIDAYDTLAKFYVSQNDPPNTIKTYNSLWIKLSELKATSNLVEAIREGIPVIAFELGRIREAEELLNQWLQKNTALFVGKDLTGLLTTKAAIQFLQSHYLDAETTFRQILLVPDGFVEDKLGAYIGIALTYALKGQFEKGFEEFEKFEQLSLATKDKETIKYTKFFKLLALMAKNRNNPIELSRLSQKIIDDNQDDKIILAAAYLIQAGLQLYQIEDDEDFLDIEKNGVEIRNALSSIDKSLTYSSQSDDFSQVIAMFAWSFKSLIYYLMHDYNNSAVNIEKGLSISKKVFPQIFPFLKAFEGQIFVESEQWQKAKQSLGEAIVGFEKQNRNITGGLNGKFLVSQRNEEFYKGMVRTLLILKETDEALIYSERTKGGIVLELNEIRKNKEAVQLPQKVSRESPKNNNFPATGKNLVPSWEKYKDFIPGTQIFTSTENDSESTVTDGNNYNIPVLNIEQTKALLPDKNTAILEFFVDEKDIYLFILADESQRGAATNIQWRKGLKWQVFVINNKAVIRNQINILYRQIKERKMIYSEYCQSVYNLLLKPVEQHLKNKQNWIIIPDDFIWKVPFPALQSQPDQFLIYNHNISFATSLNVLAQMKEIKLKRKQKKIAAMNQDILAIGISTFNEQVFNLNTPTNQLNNTDWEDISISENEKTSERSNDQITLLPLPDAAKEVQGISEIYGSKRVKLKINPLEAKEKFVKEAGKYRIVHIATHGILDNDNPMNSSLVFNNASENSKMNRIARSNMPFRNNLSTQGNIGKEQLLTTKEILDMQMNTDLIVLSACDTGNGTSKSGEGLIGLSWAFSAAGVPTIVSSKWTVNDESTAILMREFHQNLKQAESDEIGTGEISESLRKSIISLMKKDNKYIHPYYWASFITIGDP